MNDIFQIMRDPKNNWQIKVFCLYLFLIFAFALIYYSLYRRRRNHFIFNAEILAQQKDFVIEGLEARSRKIATELQLLNEALRHSQEAGVTRLEDEDEQAIDLKSGKIVLVRTAVRPADAPHPLVSPDFLCSIALYSVDGERVGRRGVKNWEDTDVAELLQDVLHRVINERKVVDERLGAIEAEGAEVWSFWDFVYFSTITQTTVGYGDILPNSTTVRSCVFLQVLLGCALVGFAINLVFRQH